MSVEDVAYEARSKAEQALRDIENHEVICAERYQGIHDSLNRVWKIFASIAASGFTVLMAVLGFLLKAQFDTITELSKANNQRAAVVAQAPQVVIQPPLGGNPITGATIEQQPSR